MTAARPRPDAPPLYVLVKRYAVLPFESAYPTLSQPRPICAWDMCGAEVPPGGKYGRFCSAKCKTADHREAVKRRGLTDLLAMLYGLHGAARAVLANAVAHHPKAFYRLARHMGLRYVKRHSAWSWLPDTVSRIAKADVLATVERGWRGTVQRRCGTAV